MRDQMDREVESLAAATGISEREAREAIESALARDDWERLQLQRRMNKTIAKVFSKARPARAAKHPRGATKASVASRKAKNRAKRKAR